MFANKDKQTGRKWSVNKCGMLLSVGFGGCVERDISVSHTREQLRKANILKPHARPTEL